MAKNDAIKSKISRHAYKPIKDYFLFKIFEKNIDNKKP
jgi:hypothetical protein